MESNWKTKIDVYLNKSIVFFLYLFAFGLFCARKLTGDCIDLICLLGIIRLIIMRENPLTHIKDKTLNLPIILFTFAMFASAIGNPYFEILSKVRRHLMIFIFFYITVANLQNLKQIKRIVTVASVSMGIATIYGTYQHYFLKMSRIEGFLSSPLSFGGFLAIYMIFLIIYFIWGKINLSYRLANFMGTILLGANLLFTQARGAWLALLGGIFTLAWIKNKKILVPFIIVCLVLALLLPQTYIERFKSSFDTKNDDSNLVRIALWKSALLMYRDHWINGIGLNRFKEEYITNYQQPIEIVNPCHTHNNLLKYMAETGTLGLIAFVWLMISIILWLYKNYQQIPKHNWRLFSLASLCSVVIFNLQGLTNVNYGGNAHGDAMRFFWLLIALNMVIVEQCKENSLQDK